MIIIIDYGVGNLFSLKSSLNAIGVEAEVSGDEEKIRNADKLILPGVGAFEDASKKLKESGLEDVIKEECAKGKPLLGICLGMQLLFEESHEYGVHKGLGLIPGTIKFIGDVIPKEFKIPQIGWNGLIVKQKSPILKDIVAGDCVYFVHSYYAQTPAKYVSATAEYGAELTAAVRKDNIYGCQFHPEKSGTVGLSILKAFCQP